MPNLELGASFVFWVNLTEELTQAYFSILPENTTINFLSIFLNSLKIVFQLKDISTIHMILYVDEQIANSNINSSYNCITKDVNISPIFEYYRWISIVFLIKHKPNKIKAPVAIYINNKIIYLTFNFLKTFSNKEKIEKINIFENLLGSFPSIMFFIFAINHLRGLKGFFKRKHLFKFLHSIDKNYYKNSVHYDIYYINKNYKISNNKEYIFFYLDVFHFFKFLN